jgi:hypothetical protein
MFVVLDGFVQEHMPGCKSTTLGHEPLSMQRASAGPLRHEPHAIQVFTCVLGPTFFLA